LGRDRLSFGGIAGTGVGRGGDRRGIGRVLQLALDLVPVGGLETQTQRAEQGRHQQGRHYGNVAALFSQQCDAALRDSAHADLSLGHRPYNVIKHRCFLVSQRALFAAMYSGLY
jgi:hypothetical protein